MQAITDLLTAISIPSIGRTLSKRSFGSAFGTFLIVVLIYSLAFSFWYNLVISDVVIQIFERAKSYLPSFSLVNSELVMHSEEPFILTFDQIKDIVLPVMRDIDEKYAKGQYAGVYETIEKQENLFCIVMDTTEEYKSDIDLSKYESYMLMNKDSVITYNKNENPPEKVEKIADNLKRDVSFSPDNAGKVITSVKGPMFIMIFIYVLIASFFRFLIKALIMSAIVAVVLLVMKRKSDFGLIYKLSLYALVPIVVIAILHRYLFPIPALIFHAVYLAIVLIACLGVPEEKTDMPNTPQ